MANYHDLRARTLGASQEEEAVTVNTRALIDKVLARYSSENTTLRELIQNAADANATSVEVRFETIPDPSPYPEYSENEALQRLPKSKVSRVLVKNDGQAFREEDWQRLKRIAEGNPDETKIGAFGVGFYSVFADCEEPFVSSGDQTMAFYWKGNSLFTRRAKMDSHDPFTTFLLDYREPTELPDLRRLCKFFATSLTFVKLNTISLYVDDKCLLQLKKKASPSMPLELPSSIKPVTQEKLMTIAGVDESRVQLDARYMNITHYRPQTRMPGGFVQSLFARVATPQPTTKTSITVENLHEYTEATIFLRIATASVKTRVSTNFARELERATKKPPPAKTSLAILTMSKDEVLASEHESEIFENVIPSNAGKVFIGFPTHQTTSFKAHISAQSVIPTVERESIDLNARVVKTWNIEMLRVAGILARIIYVDEMSQLRKRAAGLKPKDLEALYADAIHVMQQFTSVQSTPSSLVGDYVAQGFWECNKNHSIELLSTKGVLPSSDVRLSSEVTFLEGLAILPPELVKAAPLFVKHLTNGAFLTEVTISDIQEGLQKTPLTTAKATAFLEYVIKKVKSDEMDGSAMDNLLASALAMAPTTAPGGEVVENSMPVQLGEIRYFVNISKLSNDIPIPPDCVPFALTKSLKLNDLMVLGWDELNVTHWLRYVVSSRNRLPVEQNIDQSSLFAQQVLAILSKSWDTMSPHQRDEAVQLLQPTTCIPTKQGMKAPAEAYFPTVKLFADLPTVYGLHNIKDKTLVALGVRKTVDLKIVFERLMNDSDGDSATKWSHVDLIKYLTSVRSDIPDEDIKRLVSTPICKAEGGEKTLYRVSQLYEPTEELRKLKFPLLQWPGEWRPISAEAAFLFRLGLQRYPSEVNLMKKAAQNEDDYLRELALRYYISTFHTNNYRPELVYGLPFKFLPVARFTSEKGKLVLPTDCYYHGSAAILGFNVIREDLQPHAQKFGVRSDPDLADCVDRLIKKPPAGPREAADLFSYFSKRPAIPQALANRLGEAKIVPIKRGKEIVHVAPRDVYIGSADNTYGEIFDFVDFGTAASAFLMRCGSKPEPTVSEIAYQVAREPARLYGIFQSEEKYLRTLKHLAENWSTLRKDKQLVKELMSSPCLGAHVDIPVKGTVNPSLVPDGAKVEEETESIKQFELARAQQIVVIGYDFANYLIFKGEVVTAPQDDEIEAFYTSLGAVQLSSKVTDQAYITHVPGHPDLQGADELRKLVVERTRLFLHQQDPKTIKSGAVNHLETSLNVQFVRAIRLKKTLKLDNGRAVAHDQQRTATIQHEQPGSKKLTLFVTRKYQTYDIANVMIELVLNRAPIHAAFLLDSLLSTDLYTLKARGFNVDRILKAKHAEARLMEQNRLAQMAEQQKHIDSQEKQFQAAEAERVRQKAIADKATAAMPGGFGFDSPQKPRDGGQPEDGDGFFGKGFSRFSRLLKGDKRPSIDDTHHPPAITHEAAPTPDSATPQQQQKVHDNTKPPPATATEPHRIRANLLRAIQASRTHDSSSVFSRPETFEVKEESHFCDSRPGQNLAFAASTPAGIKFYFSNTLEQSEREAWMKANVAALAAFAQLLRGLADVYGMGTQTLHVYYDETGTTIAFNRGGAVFCNVRFFLQLGQWKQGTGTGYAGSAVSYWFVVVAHELAHNLKADHGSEHSFYAESFVQEYFDKAMTMVREADGAAAAPAAPEVPPLSPPPSYAPRR